MTSAQRLRDAILENSALRDGLTDDQAQPLIDWGLALADEVGAKIDQMPADDLETNYETYASALLKLMTRITWVATYRSSKGEAWTQDTLAKLNELNRTLRGESAPQISETTMHGYAQQIDGLDQGALVRELMQQLSPTVQLLPPPQEDSTHGET